MLRENWDRKSISYDENTERLEDTPYEDSDFDVEELTAHLQNLQKATDAKDASLAVELKGGITFYYVRGSDVGPIHDAPCCFVEVRPMLFTRFPLEFKLQVEEGPRRLLILSSIKNLLELAWKQEQHTNNDRFDDVVKFCLAGPTHSNGMKVVVELWFVLATNRCTFVADRSHLCDEFHSQEIEKWQNGKYSKENWENNFFTQNGHDVDDFGEMEEFELVLDEEMLTKADKRMDELIHLFGKLAEAKAEAKTLLEAQLETLKKNIENKFSADYDASQIS